MRIGWVSDVHLEFGNGRITSVLAKFKEADLDVIAFAGDVHHAPKALNFIKRMGHKYSKAHILFVPGNHEYYGSSTSKVQRLFEEAVYPENVHYLHRTEVEIGGVLFAGCSLWYPLTEETYSFKDLLNDFNCIKEYDPWVFDEHRRDRKFLEEFTRGDSGKKRVVVTHHPPAARSINPKYADDPTNCYYNAMMEDCLGFEGAWIHGHVHDPCDWMAGDTRVIANPLGYPGQRYEWNLEILEIS